MLLTGSVAGPRSFDSQLSNNQRQLHDLEDVREKNNMLRNELIQLKR